jgi:L,D-transpeptidase ErfK/SrfK
MRIKARGRALLCACAAVLVLVATPARATEFRLAPGDKVVGNLADYVVQPGDNLADIARHFDVGYTEIVAANPGVDPWSPGVGRKLTIPSLYILPDAPRQGIVINLGDRRLYYFPPKGGTVQTYPIGIGAIGFTTPLSTTRVVRKEPHPTWVPPPSIHAENPDLPAVVGPGPDNPLGDYALRLGWTNYLLHGTNKPDGVGRNVSHGCIHLYPEDIEKLFSVVPVGTPVRAIEQQSATGWIGIGLYVQAHPSKEQADEIDTEQPMTPAPLEGLREQVNAVAGNYAQTVDWRTVDQAGLQRDGLPVQVATRPPPDLAQNQAPELAQGQLPLDVVQTSSDDTPAPVPALQPKHSSHRHQPKHPTRDLTSR